MGLTRCYKTTVFLHLDRLMICNFKEVYINPSICMVISHTFLDTFHCVVLD